ncbi:MAG: CBS domain-containing protein [Cyanobacteria bacterium P01_D01_bin.1]
MSNNSFECLTGANGLQVSNQLGSEVNLEVLYDSERVEGFNLRQLPNEISAESEAVPTKLQEIALQVQSNNAGVQATVRTLLSWFGAKRRGLYVVDTIQNALSKLGLTTDPDFTNVYIDSEVHIIPAWLSSTDRLRHSPVEENAGLEREVPDATAEVIVGEYVSGAIEDPTFRIGNLEAANKVPIAVSPDSDLLEATTLMMFHDFSQLPAMQGEREVKGVVSWESIGKRKALCLPCEKVRDCMEIIVPEVPSEFSLFSAIDLIIKHGYVLVRQRDRRISGIVTTTDLSLQFRQLAEPFLLVGEIENYIRRLIDGKFTSEQLSSVQNPNDRDRTICTVSDLTFGEYLRLLEKPEYWEILQIPVSRTIFIKKLHRIREIRNDVMHFDPDPFAEEDLQVLRWSVNFMRNLDLKRD